MNIIIEGEDKKYYNKKPKGYSPCILGNPKHRNPELNVLVNCVGWATGRFNQLGHYGDCKYLGNTNAENFTNYCKTQGLILGQTPKVGACMVWEGKGSLAGHVCIVEQVISPTELIISESGWSFTKEYYRTITRKKGSDGRWGMGSKYTFKGFIYNPTEIKPATDKIELPKRGYFTKGDKGKDVGKIDQWLYEMYGNKKVLGDLYGNNTVKEVKKFQKWARANGTYTGKYATIDGNIGRLTLEAMRKAGFPY